jgi:hypothetical protein
MLAFRSSTRVWAELHEKAFRRLGGSPRIAVLDIPKHCFGGPVCAVGELKPAVMETANDKTNKDAGKKNVHYLASKHAAAR